MVIAMSKTRKTKPKFKKIPKGHMAECGHCGKLIDITPDTLVSLNDDDFMWVPYCSEKCRGNGHKGWHHGTLDPSVFES
jgi:hypothetical protein